MSATQHVKTAPGALKAPPTGSGVGVGSSTSNTLNSTNFLQKTLSRTTKISRGSIERAELKPSELLRITSLDTQRYAEQVTEVRPARIVELMSTEDVQKDTGLDINEPLFQPYPSDVRFQCYVPFETYETSITFCNLDRITRKIKIQPFESPFFKVLGASASSSRVAPGMDVTFRIQFSPDDVKDYSEDLVCITDREKFVVPVRAIGARAVLDLPDTIVFPTIIVKHSQLKTLLVRNIGSRKAIVAFSASDPFSIEPLNAQLEAQQSMQVHVRFCPAKVGSATGKLKTTYSTGEEVISQLVGSSEDGNVRLEKSSLRLDTTSISKICQRSVRIFNRSDVSTHFDWKATATAAEEERQRLNNTIDLQRNQTEEVDAFSLLLQSDPSMRDNVALLTRSFKRGQWEVQGDSLTADDVFSIEPISGDIWPNTEAEMIVTFRPTQETTYSKTLFCDITGRETRLPLKLRGDGVGARLALQCDTLDLGATIISSEHVYQLQVRNTCDIPARYVMVTPKSNGMMGLIFTPTTATIGAGESAMIQINFRAAILGEIDEDITMMIDDVVDPVRLRVFGRVVGPRLQFDAPAVDFGVAAFSFKSTQMVNLTNMGPVPVAFALRMNGNGQGDFGLTPALGNLPANSSLAIRLDFTPLQHQIYELNLVLDAAAAGNDFLCLPVSAECVVPEVTINVDCLIYGRCFTLHPYTQHFELQNLSELPAKYECTIPGSNAAMVTIIPVNGVVPAGGVLKIAVTIVLSVIGDFSAPIIVTIAGSPVDPLRILLNAIGQGAVLAVVPDRLDWQKLALLSDEPRSLTISNVSLIPAHFTFTFASSPSVYTVEPSSGVLQPGTSGQFVVHTCLDDTLRFHDELLITSVGGSVLRVDLSAIGVGSMIASDQPLDSLNFKDMFSNRECNRRIELTNRGRRSQKLVFVLDSPPPGVSGHCTIMNGGSFKKVRTPACPNPPDPQYSVFGIYPERLSLAPGESCEIEVRGMCASIGRMEETILCKSENQANFTKPEILFRMQVSANFISPLVEATPSSVMFSVAKISSAAFPVMKETVTIRNVSPLSLTPILVTRPPFTLVSNIIGVLAPGEAGSVSVFFDPNLSHDSTTRTETSQICLQFKEHPHTEIISVRAHVSFPTIILDPPMIDFDCIVNNTIAHHQLKLTNNGHLPVDFTWSLQNNHGISVGQLIDIIPIRGLLQPGQSQLTEVFFHGATNSILDTSAVCAVKDGSSYYLPLKGRASEEKFHFHSSTVSFGEVPYDEILTRLTSLSNTGLVPLHVTVIVPSDNKWLSLTVDPMTFVLHPSSKQEMCITGCPLLLSKTTSQGRHSFQEQISFQIANAPLQHLKLTGSVIFPRLTVGLDREAKAENLNTCVETDQHLSSGAEIQEDRNRAIDHVAIEHAMLSHMVDVHRPMSDVTRKRRPHLPSYMLHFGSVVLEESVSRTVPFTNDSNTPISFAVGKLPFWLTVKPEKVTALPSRESIDLVFTMAARSTQRMSFPLGVCECNVVIDVTRGPFVDLLIQGLVCVPALNLSSNMVDFGNVDCGMCSVKYIRLSNKKAVKVEWSIFKEKKVTTCMSKKMIVAEAERQAMIRCFEISPSSGTLLPGEYIDMKFNFVPIASQVFSSHVALSVKGIADYSEILLNGVGVDAELIFTPLSLTMGPTLPGFPGAESYVTISNPSSKTVEVYSLDFDQQYRAEEKILSQLNFYDVHNRMLIPPRLPGTALPSEILNFLGGSLISKTMEGSSNLYNSTDVFGDAITKLAQASVGIVSDVSPAQAAVDRHLGITAKREKAARDGGGMNGIVYGPVGSGKGALASALAKNYGGIVVQFDSLIEELLAVTPPSSLALRVREACIADISSADFLAALTSELVAEVLSNRALQADALNGLMLDGITSKYCVPTVLMTASLLVLGSRANFAVFHLTVTDRSVLAHRLQQHEATDALLEPVAPTAIAEDIYDAMPLAEKDAYDHKFAQYKFSIKLKLKRDVDLKAQEAARIVEEESRLEAENAKFSKRNKIRNANAASKDKSPGAPDHKGPNLLTPSMGRKSGISATAGSNSGINHLLLPHSAGHARLGLGEAMEDDLSCVEEYVADEYEAEVQLIIDHWDRATGKLAGSYASVVEARAQKNAVVTKGSGKSTVVPGGRTTVMTRVETTLPLLQVESDTLLLSTDEDSMTVEKPITHLVVDATPALAVILEGLFHNSLIPTPAAILSVLQYVDTSIPISVDYSVVHRPRLRDLPVLMPSFTLIDKEYFLALAAAAASAASEVASIKEDIGNPRFKRPSESRGGSRDKEKIGTLPHPPSAKIIKDVKGKSLIKKGDEATEVVAVDDPASHANSLVLGDGLLKNCRWVIPAGGEVKLHVRFQTSNIGQVNQTLSFETLGSLRRYTIFFRGICDFPTIIRNPKVIFGPLYQSKPKGNGIVIERGYNLKNNVVDFGPILCGKSRDQFKTDVFETNVIKFTMSNPSLTDISVVACFENDVNFGTFTLEPFNCTIPAGSDQVLRVWAYPKEVKEFKDRLIICVKDNPEPMVFNISAEGDSPALELDRTTLSFDRVLLHKRDTRTLGLKNKTKLPVSWTLVGVEGLGEEFSAGSTSGVIEPLGDFTITLTFRALKAMTVKKFIRLDISDAEGIVGTLPTHTISVLAEAYDVLLDVIFPKGGAGGLDFDTMQVFHDKFVMCTLKNKGKYEFFYKFTIDKVLARQRIPDFHEESLVITPSQASLQPSDKSATVKFTFRTRQELNLQNIPLIKCEVSSGEGDHREIIAELPINFSVKAVYSKYALVPARGVNFGAVTLGDKQQQNLKREIIIENHGDFDFKFAIARGQTTLGKRSSRKSILGALTTLVGISSQRSNISTPSLESNSAAVPKEPTSNNPQLRNNFEKKVTLGCFTISPMGGTVPCRNADGTTPGIFKITVDADPQIVGKDERCLLFDIDERQKDDNPKGISYALAIEGCVPAINRDFSTLFCEHVVVPRFDVTTDVVVPTFSIEDMEFYFGPVIVGYAASMKLRISNPTKVTCEVSVNLRGRDPTAAVVGANSRGKPTTITLSECFRLDVNAVSIPSHEHRIVIVEFAPNSIQSCYATLDISVEDSSQNSSDLKPLAFDIRADGILPQVAIVKPAAKSANGIHMLHFRRTLLNHSGIAIVEVRNTSPVVAKASLILIAQHERKGQGSRPVSAAVKGGFRPSTSQAPPTPIHVGKAAPFRRASTDLHAKTIAIPASKPIASKDSPRKNITVTSAGNQGLPTVGITEDVIVEGSNVIQDETKIFQISPAEVVEIQPMSTFVFKVKFSPNESRAFTGQMRLQIVDNDFEMNYIDAQGDGYVDEVSIEGLDAEERICFNDVAVGASKTVQFSIINHATDIARFEIPPTPNFTFTPSTGHILPNLHAAVSVVFSSAAPLILDNVSFQINLSKIKLEVDNSSSVGPWNNILKTVRWDVKESDNGRLLRICIEEPVPEPVHVVTSPIERNVPVKVQGVCDFTSYELSVAEILFSETSLLQSRAFPLVLTNTGKVQLDFNFEIADDNLIPVRGALPFIVSPTTGSIPPGNIIEIKVLFMPKDVREFDATLWCRVANGAPTALQATAVKLNGSSVRPLCHLDLGGDSKHNGTNQNNALEFVACGLGASVTKKILVVNPMTSDYTFKWVEMKSTVPISGKVSPEFFRCLTPSGIIPAGTKFEMAFEFLPDSTKSVENFWNLIINEHKLSFPVELIGRTREPRLNLSKSTLNFGIAAATLPQVTQIDLINEEAELFLFSFDEQHINNINLAAVLKIEPQSGKVGPNSRITINVTFVPSIAQLYDLVLPCTIKRKAVPLSLRIQCNVFQVACRLAIDDSGNFVPVGSVTKLDMGSTYVYDKILRNLLVINHGSVPLVFEWKLIATTSKKCISIEPSKGTVMPGSKLSCLLSFMSESPINLIDIIATCHVELGPVYQLSLSAVCVEPLVAASVTHVEYDKVFVVNPEMSFYERTVTITNSDKEAVSLRCLYAKTANLQVTLMSSKTSRAPASPTTKEMVKAEASQLSMLLAPGAKIDALFVFSPRAVGSFEAKVDFEINSRSILPVKVSGTAVVLRLQLEKPADRVVAFGALAMGTNLERTVTLVNRSVLPVSFILQADVASLIDHCISIRPGELTTLAPKSSCPISVKFTPEGRIESFTEEISVRCLSQIEPLLNITGCCQAVQLELDVSQLPFGTVSVNSTTQRRVLMTNTGDIGAHFRWKLDRVDKGEKLSNWFTLFPTEGYISPGHEVSLSVTFHPKVAKSDVRFECIQCAIEGSSPLLLDMTGSSVSQFPEKDSVIFSTTVRHDAFQKVTIDNKSSSTWILKPIFESEHFSSASGSETFVVEAGSSAPFEIKYHPLVMTQGGSSGKQTNSLDSKLHTETLFIPLPDGNALLYNLIGTSLPPKPIVNPLREVPCKLAYTETLNVTNWLKRPQRFKVTINRIKVDPSTVIKGLEYFDLPGSTTKAFQVQFYAYKEATATVEVVFRNEATLEFISFECIFKSTAPGTMDTVHLTSIIRQSTSHTIFLENPLNSAVSFNVEKYVVEGSKTTNTVCTEIQCNSSHRVPGQTKNFSFQFEFLPVRAREFNVRLTFVSSELGLFQYDLILTGLPAPLMPLERYKITLGEKVVRRFSFKNFIPVRADYTIAFESPEKGTALEFSAPSALQTPPTSVLTSKQGIDVGFDVTYEPVRLGDARCTMIVSSPVGGEYLVPLSGQCLAPKPSGPHTVRMGERLKLPFKNVFNTSETFSFTCDNPSFSVKPHETFKAKDEKEISISYKNDNARDDVAATCKLCVVCTTGIAAGTDWIFYLKSAPAEK